MVILQHSSSQNKAATSQDNNSDSNNQIAVSHAITILDGVFTGLVQGGGKTLKALVGVAPGVNLAKGSVAAVDAAHGYLAAVASNEGFVTRAEVAASFSLAGGLLGPTLRGAGRSSRGWRVRHGGFDSGNVLGQLCV